MIIIIIIINILKKGWIMNALQEAWGVVEARVKELEEALEQANLELGVLREEKEGFMKSAALGEDIKNLVLKHTYTTPAPTQGQDASQDINEVINEYNEDHKLTGVKHFIEELVITAARGLVWANKETRMDKALDIVQTQVNKIGGRYAKGTLKAQDRWDLKDCSRILDFLEDEYDCRLSHLCGDEEDSPEDSDSLFFK